MSREGAFLVQNFLLVGLVAAVLWGTMLPLVSGLAGTQRVVGPAYYERVSAPIFLCVLLLLAAAPLLPWRRAGRTWMRALAWPVAAALVAAAFLIWTEKHLAALQEAIIGVVFVAAGLLATMDARLGGILGEDMERVRASRRAWLLADPA